jgi:hypothetical protein
MHSRLRIEINWTLKRSRLRRVIDGISSTRFKRLVDKVAVSPFFSIMIDESSDVEHKSELILYVRYFVDDQRVIVTDFFQIVHVPNTSAEELCKAVINAISTARGTDSNTHIDLLRMSGIATDGASNMLGVNNGVQKKLSKAVNEYLIGIHCMAHRLALASADFSQFLT